MELATLLVGLATEALKLINTESSRKYVNELLEIQKEIQEEEAKGYDANDAKIEALQKRIKIVAEAVKNEIMLHVAKSSS